ncbi:PEP-CTERM sorting domain-containing protein [Pseudoduganella sp. OTU4001]|uniref:PEP-CTERM sorting domain-containing protein n=1 Tax=Pseudoduganella sp. OTU4001 TaxID=3043854 RepID=UPI00313ABD36
MLTLRKFLISMLALASMALTTQAHAGLIGYADVVLDYFDSGAGPMAGPYGGTYPTGPGFPIAVSTSVVLGNEPGTTGFPDFLSLPTGSYVTVGFTDETVIDGVGDDIFIQEVGANGERANVYVSADAVNFIFLGVAADDVTTAFDLASIGFTDAVRAIKIVGLDAFGGSPGFDVMNVQVLPGSIGPAPVPAPGTLALAVIGLAGLAAARRNKKQAQ